MPYRGDVHALESRRDTLAKELADLRARARELADVARTEAELAKELASVERMLGDIAPAKRALPMLDDVRIASPCNASWDDMVVDAANASVRFCGQCAKNVYNLSEMPRVDAERVLREKEGKLCARIYRRTDGTLITADCPVGVRRRRVRRAAVAAVGGGILAFAGVMSLRAATVRMGDVRPTSNVDVEEIRPMMGDVAPEQAPPSASQGTVAAMGTVAMIPQPQPQPPAKKASPVVAKPKARAR